MSLAGVPANVDGDSAALQLLARWERESARTRVRSDNGVPPTGEPHCGRWGAGCLSRWVGADHWEPQLRSGVWPCRRQALPHRGCTPLSCSR